MKWAPKTGLQVKVFVRPFPDDGERGATMRCDESERSVLPWPYDVFVEAGSQLELEMLWESVSEDWDSLWEGESLEGERDLDDWFAE